MGYKVLLDSGITGRDVTFEDATIYSFSNNYLEVGTGTGKYGSGPEEVMGRFNRSKVCGIVEI